MSTGVKEHKKKTPLNAALKASMPALSTAVVFSLFINVLALVSPLYMMQVYDRVLTSRNEFTLLVLTLIVIFLFVVYAALEALRARVLVRGGVRFDNVIHGPVFDAVMDVSIGRSTTEAQAFRDTDNVREFVSGAGLIAFCDVPWIPVFVVVSYLLHPFFGYLAIGSGAVIFLLAVANDFATRSAIGLATRASIAAQGDVTATLRNVEVMKAMGMWGGLQRRWQVRRDELIAWQAIASDRGAFIMAIIKFTRQVVQTLILGGGAYLAIKGSISAGTMIAASILVGRALAPIEGAVGQWKALLGARGAWERLQHLFHATAAQTARMNLPRPRGRLSVENAVVVPPGSKIPTLRSASFIMEPGTVLGIVGPSAAGKSSLVRALVGVWPTVAGAIRLDGFDLKHWDPQDLGQYVGYLPQDVELFFGTVAENIARFREVEPEMVIQAAQLAGVHEMIQQLPEGYETQIGEAGLALSGGQRQRVALARAVFGLPPLIILDEPNASLDAQGEAALTDTINHMRQAGCSVIFVTHKLNLLGTADKIAVLNGGAIQAFGDREEILAKLFGGPRAVMPVQAAG